MLCGVVSVHDLGVWPIQDFFLFDELVLPNSRCNELQNVEYYLYDSVVMLMNSPLVWGHCHQTDDRVKLFSYDS